MDTPDYEDYEQKRRKEEMIKYRTKKRNTSIFMTVATIFNIVLSLIIILLLFVILTFFMFKVFHGEGETAMQIFRIAMIVIFFGGLFLGFIIYKQVIRWAIKKFNLEEKLLDEIIERYIKDTKLETEKKLKR
ncbi:MAG: hypothetical protein MJ188_00150 [Treponema sp.]|nr:hypothetical protein [Treponema sp.]